MAQKVNIAKILETILNDHSVAIDEIANQYFSPYYRQRTNGRWDDRAEFIKHLHKLREVVSSAKIEVIEELQQANLYADRHLVTAVKKDGSITTQEVYLFAELDNQGRFVRVEETTLMLHGTEQDKNLGSIK